MEKHSSHIKRLLAALLSCSIAVSALAGCSDNAATSESSDTSASVQTGEAPSTTSSAESPGVPIITDPIAILAERLRSENGLIANIEALSLDGKCIAADTAFRVTSKQDVSAEELKARLSIYPSADLKVEKESEKSYLVRSATALPEGTIVQLKAADAYGEPVDSWAFQTSESFKIKSTYPANDSDYVYLDSGIEIEFSNPVDADTAAKYFEISPALSGSFTTHRNTLCFIPSENMKANTRYTVTVKEGLPSTESGVLEKEHSFSFNTYSSSKGEYFDIYNYNGGRSETYLPDDPHVFEITCSDELKEKDFQISLYRCPSAEAYSNAQLDYFRNGSADTSSLEQVYSELQKPIPNLVEWRPMFLMLQEDLAEGYYIADISVNDIKQQLFVQISPISVFVLSLGEEKTFFINDTNTGKAAVGAQVVLTADGRSYTAKTGADGLAFITTANDESEWGTIDISYNGSRYVDAFFTGAEDEEDYDSKYYMYLYTDREAYLTSDTISVWGLIRPRYDGVAVPKDISMCLGNSETDGEIKKLNVAADGTFRTEFTYTNYAESYYVQLSLLDGDKLMHEKRIQIRDYVKPNYVFDVELPNYAIMPHINTVPMSISAQFYEGTPAKGLVFDSNARSCYPDILKTDDNGYISAELLFEDRDTWELCYTGHHVDLTGVENEYTYSYQNLYSFYRDVMFEHKYDKSTRTLTVSTTRLDFDKIEEFLADGRNDYDILKGGAFNTDVSLDINHYWTERVEDGTYYDHIQKRNVTKYKNESHEEYIGSYSVTTKNGVGVLSDLPLTSDKGHYSVSVSYKDSLGQNVTDYFNIANREIIYYYRNPNYLYYSLTAQMEEDEWEITFSENEQLSFYLECNDEPVTDKGGRVFFAVHQNDLITQEVFNSTEFSYSPSLSCIPNARFVGAYFDGKHVFPAAGDSISFDPEQRNIDLTVTTDKNTYDAGETVQLTVKATDENGRAVSGAAVQVSVVDEAAFAIAPQTVDFLNDVYRFVYYPYSSSYFSYVQHVMDESGGGEKGGGGDDSSVRKDFKDTAYFDAKTTDSTGVAKFTIKLADNLTTWRTTIHAVKEAETGRIYAGHRTHPIVSTRPLFITPIMLDTYIEGDDIAVSAKCQGLDKNDVINVRLTGDGVDMTLEAGSAKTVNFGKLPIGEYKVLFTAEKDGNRDAVELPLTVTDSILETDITNAFDMSEGVEIAPAKWPVTLTFFDKEYMFYTEILRDLNRYCGDRSDMQIASSFAAMQFGYIDEEAMIDEHRALTYHGFASVLPAAESSAELTALIAAAAPRLINRGAVIPEFEYLINSQESSMADICVGYMGLAALGQPVLEEIRAALASGLVTDYYDRMRLVAALALCGDNSTAYKYYVQYTPDITLNNSDPDNVFAYIDCESSEIQERTKLALITAATLKMPEAEWFARYLISEEPVYDSYALELMIYLQNYVPKTEGDAVFTYKLDGKTETVKLDRHHGYTMRFGEEQFKNAEFTVTSGAVYTVANYIGRMEEQSKPASLTVTKSFSNTGSVGDIVMVTITTAPNCRVDDVIPSCGRYVERHDDDCYYRSGQRVQLYTDKYGTAQYFFRITTEGEYVVESALAQQNMGEEWGVSERTSFSVEYTYEAA